MKNLLFIFFFFAASCNVVKKSSAITKTKTDSTSFNSLDSVRFFRIDTSAVSSNIGDYERTSTYAFDTVRKYVLDANNPGRYDTVIKYVPRIVTVFEKGHYNNQEAVRKIVFDSSAVQKDNKTLVSNEEETVTKSKVSSRFGWLPLVVIGLFLAFLAILYIKLK